MERVPTSPTKVCFRILGALLLLFQDGAKCRMMANLRGQLIESGSPEQGWGDPLTSGSDVFTSPGFDFFDRSSTPLPPCDFNHRRAGFDCWPKELPATRTVAMGVMHDGNSSEGASPVLAQGWGDPLPPCGACIAHLALTALILLPLLFHLAISSIREWVSIAGHKISPPIRDRETKLSHSKLFVCSLFHGCIWWNGVVWGAVTVLASDWQSISSSCCWLFLYGCRIVSNRNTGFAPGLLFDWEPIYDQRADFVWFTGRLDESLNKPFVDYWRLGAST